MGLLSILMKNTVLLPINVAKDIVTLGGVLIDEKSALKKQEEEFESDIDDEIKK
jgi:hypothetical protein